VTAVVFDFGGVMFRWQPLALLQEVVPELAPDEATARETAVRIFQSFEPQSDWAQFDLGRIAPEVLTRRIAARIGAAEAQIRRVVDAIPGHLEAHPESVALMRRLKAAGHRLYYLSNMPEPYAVHLEREHAFMADFADGIFSARVGLMKPDAAIFRLAQQRFALDPPRTMFVDDHRGNVDAARALGWHALHFRSAAQCEDDARALGWV
jgi:putative hydrolase of the HAD superfamily